jgi:hypothetical protein
MIFIFESHILPIKLIVVSPFTHFVFTDVGRLKRVYVVSTIPLEVSDAKDAACRPAGLPHALAQRL